MAFARMGERWTHTARLCWMLYAVNRTDKSPEREVSAFLPDAFKPDAFKPDEDDEEIE